MISQGVLKNLVLQVPAIASVRPTKIRLRSAVTQILRHFVQEKQLFIDIFAGSGVVGLEALSIGFLSAIFIEKHPDVIRQLKLNIFSAHKRFHTHSEEKSILIYSSLNRLFKIISKRVETSIVLWADPPYANSQYWQEFLMKNLLVHQRQKKILMMEMPTKLLKNLEEDSFSRANPSWVCLKQKVFGNSTLIIWESYQHDSSV